MTAQIVAIHLSDTAGAPMRSVARVQAVAGVGLEGDRYATRQGHWSPIRRAGDQLTLIEQEVLRELDAAHGFGLLNGNSRRNVTTAGIRLDELIGRRFRLGEAVCRAVRRCEPCSYLEGLLGRPVLVPLVHRGGIRVEILEGGAIAVGDAIEPLDEDVAATA